MSEAQDWYDKVKANPAAENKDRIQQVLKADLWELQTVLHLKMNCSALEDAEHHTVGAGTTFGFNEKLVNRLMHLAYLYGCKDIELKSFERGYHACKMEMAKDIESFVEKYGMESDLN